MSKRKRNRLEPATTEQILLQYLFEICVDLGFCLPPGKKKELVGAPCTTATMFVEEVMRIEGLSPQFNRDYFDQLHERLVRKIGGEVIYEVKNM